MKKFPKVYIIILNYNSWGDTIECLESVLRNDYPNYQVIVVDNNSPNNSMEYIKKWAEGKLDVWVEPGHPLRVLSFPPVKKPIPYIYYTRKEAEKGGNIEVENKLAENITKEITTKYPLVFIQTGENLGFAGGNNVGIRYALNKKDSDYILILNNDSVIERNIISSAIKIMQSDNSIGILGFATYDYNNPEKVEYFYSKDFIFYGPRKVISLNNDKHESVINCEHVIGNCMMIRTNVLEKFLLPEDYFLYYEETDFCNCVRKYTKYQIKSFIESKVFHKLSSSTGLSSPLQLYYSRRNKCFYMKKWKSKFEFFVFFLFHTLTTLFKIVKYRKAKKTDKALAVGKAYIDFLKGKKGKGW